MLTDVGTAFLGAGYLLLAVFVVVERRLRKTGEARSLSGGTSDGGTTSLVGFAFGAGILLPPILDELSIGTYSIDVLVGLVALAAMLLGLSLRVWAALTLGAYYTRTLVTSTGQRVVDDGPYGAVRHPGYLGATVMWSGFGVLSGNEILALVLPVTFLAVYIYRIGFEERMLVNELGAPYVEYQKRSKRLIPGIY
ncbi:MAG: isoprenylcysteine carboxylmethyltransferase family protein [Nitrososphaerales archaeon]|jgi:protein-S-isoprenylcysteine O-methyltransferase Ste14